MSKELRTEINDIILSLPENKLETILEYLKQVKQSDEKQLEMAEYLSKILNEDAELLKRLAQW